MDTDQKTYTGVSHRCSACGMEVRVGAEELVQRAVPNRDGVTYLMQYDHADTDDCVERVEVVAAREPARRCA